MPREIQESDINKENYGESILKKVLQKIEWMKEWVEVEHNLTGLVTIKEKMGSMAKDVGSSITRDTKYTKMVTLYWHCKTLLGKAIME